MKHISKTLFTFAALAITLPFSAQASSLAELPSGTYALDKTHASLTWKVSHLGLSNYTARFTDFDVTLNLDTQNPEGSSVIATINPTSLETDYPNPEEHDFDKKISTGEEWLNAVKFPEITFTSTKLEKTGESTGKMTGDLTFLGVTKPVTLDVTLNGAMLEQPFSKKPTVGFSAHGTLKRSEWGFDTYVPNIGDEVEIIIETELAKQN